MNQKRLIIASFISVILISILYIGTTYSVYTTTSPDEEINIYKTGNLSIEITGDNETIKNILPTSIEKSDQITPYRLSVKNNGTVPYKFNVILDETTGSNKINHEYIMTRVGSLDVKSLNECNNNVLKEGIVVLPNNIVEIDVRIWITDKVPNSEMNKSFYAKLKIEGSATQSKIETDNTTLINPLHQITQSEDSQDSPQQSDNKEIES